MVIFIDIANVCSLSLSLMLRTIKKLQKTICYSIFTYLFSDPVSVREISDLFFKLKVVIDVL